MEYQFLGVVGFCFVSKYKSWVYCHLKAGEPNQQEQFQQHVKAIAQKKVFSVRDVFAEKCLIFQKVVLKIKAAKHQGRRVVQKEFSWREFLFFAFCVETWCKLDSALWVEFPAVYVLPLNGKSRINFFFLWLFWKFSDKVSNITFSELGVFCIALLQVKVRENFDNHVSGRAPSWQDRIHGDPVLWERP